MKKLSSQVKNAGINSLYLPALVKVNSKNNRRKKILIDNLKKQASQKN